MRIYEAAADRKTMEKLISLSKDWEAENSCYGYRANEPSDIEGNRIFLAEEEGEVTGYLFGRICRSENMKSVMPEGTPFFEVEELYVIPRKRSQGTGSMLFRTVEDNVKDEAEYMVLSTATKNWKAILHFYIEELGMQFWSARLFRKLRDPYAASASPLPESSGCSGS